MSDLGVGRGLTRVEFLRHAGAVGVVVGAGGVLVACGSSSSPGASTAAGPPRKGGTLQMGYIGAGPLESFDPHFGLAAPVTQTMQNLVYDNLTNFAVGKLSYSLATRVEPNADASEFLIELRPGVTWHDGSPLTPEDVIWSLRYAQLPESYTAPFAGMIDAKGLKKDGANKVRVPLVRPYARLAPILSAPGMVIVKDGTKKFDKPVGTGAFKVTSFAPGQRSTYVRNAEYWDTPPYLDGVQIISFGDPTAMISTLQSGQLDIVPALPQGRAKAQESNPNLRLYVSKRTQGPNVFVMRVDRAPLDDARVRLAMKLVVDRPALLNNVFGGYGIVSNDVMGNGYPLYDTSLPQREQDIEQAKSLLKQAGRSDLSVSLVTSDALEGMKESAILFAQQAGQAGITVKVDTVPASSYFNPGSGYLSRVFSQDGWPTVTLESLWDATLRTDAPSNQTHWTSPGWDEMIDRGEAEIDLAKAAELWKAPQKIQYDQGGYIIAVDSKTVGAASTSVHGLDGPDTDWPLRSYSHTWLSS